MLRVARMTSSTSDRARQLINLLLIPACVVANVLVQRRGEDVGDVSRSTETLFMAAGWAFAIWGLLFALQLAYAVFQALPSQRSNPVLRRIGGWTALNAVCLGVWPFLFTARAFTSAWLLIVIDLVVLVMIELRLGDAARTGRELWLIRVPFSLLMGWVSVATLLNTTQWLTTTAEWQGGSVSPLAWSVLLTLVAFGLAVTLGLGRKNPAFVAAVAWGVAGIASHAAGQSSTLMAVAAACSVALGLLVIGEVLAMRLGRLPIDLEGHRFLRH